MRKLGGVVYNKAVRHVKAIYNIKRLPALYVFISILKIRH
tara:strand:- start:7265 stop:7384 length:120 start_codon:yes stop_codon:yes gene_type:complete